LFTIHCSAQSPSISFSLLANYGLPVGIENVGDDRLFIIDKLGTIGIIDTFGTVNPTPFLNISSQITANGERGLLGLAFHPSYATNGYFYVNYTDLNGDTNVSRFSVSTGNPNQANPSSEQILLTISQPYTNHNAGDLSFGPDGYLYIATGDGGNGGDPDDNGQDAQTLLGNILRIDVDNGNPYAIPPSNPFVGNPNGLNEIWSYGLRNPWRISFDQLTGDLWIADVGQGSWEEVNFQPSTSTGGENYGWRCYEGNQSYNSNNCPAASSLTFPVSEYPHNPNTGGFSITGGFVYRGSQYPCLYGKYIYMDYVTDHLWTVEPDGLGGWNTTFYDANNFALGNSIVSFGQDANNELYACSYSGDIYKIEGECNVDTQLDVKVLLEGTYDSGGQMFAKLQNIIPLNQPYSGAPYNYAGTESLSSIPINMVDWVFVELRTGTPNPNGSRNTITAFTQAAILLDNGNVIGTDGNPLTFKLPIDTDYYVVIRHRNHIDIFSQNTFTSGNNATFDFTNGQNAGIGANPMKTMFDGRTALYAGDFIPDHTIQNTDNDLWKLSPAILYSYNNLDATLDGIIQVTDFDAWYRNRSVLGNSELDY